MSTISHFINGELVTSPNEPTLPVINPADESTVGEVLLGRRETVNDALRSAEAAYPEWSKTTPVKRARILFEFRALLIKERDTLAHIVTEEHGKVLDDARGSVARGIELVEYLCGMPALLRGSYSQNVGSEVDCMTIREPLGVCVGVSPFNFPVMVPVWLFASAIAFGNTFILKPSEQDPSAPLFLAQLFKQAGLPDGVFNVVHGDKETVDALITSPIVKAVSAVASTPVAKHIYETAISHGKRAHTFGGAKNHCVVMPDADMDKAADALLGSAFGAAGERCMAVSVALAVTDSVGDALVERLKAKVPELKIGPGHKADVDMGPLISEAHKTRVVNYIAKGVDEGATLVIDGRELTINQGKGFFLGGCLFDHVTPQMTIYQEEIFGPVLCVVRVPDLTTAIDLINNHRYGNGTSIFTQSGGCARQFADAIEVGMVGINVPIPVPIAHHSFGGWKQSMFGDVALHGDASMQFYTRAKSITLRWPQQKAFDTGFFMPTHQDD